MGATTHELLLTLARRHHAETAHAYRLAAAQLGTANPHTEMLRLQLREAEAAVRELDPAEHSQEAA